MSHRFRALEELEAELVRVTARPRAHVGRRSFAWRVGDVRRSGRIPLLIAGVALLFLTATIALAATGEILAGAPVPAPRMLSPVLGAGLPLPGQARLLALRVADPNGGLPWGMRVVRTTRGLVCVQIGRVQNGQLGELGIDGAYHDDGRFHAVGPGVLPTYAGGATEGGVMSERGSCVFADGDVTGNGEAWGSAVAAEFWGVSENAAFAVERHAGPVQSRRDISYGILGPHAVSVSYRAGGAVRSEQVAAGVGAYLIVQPAEPDSTHEGHGEAPGTDTPGEGPGIAGAVAVITYDHHGTVCESGGSAKVEHPCPQPNPYPVSLRVTPPGSFVRHLKISLQVRRGAVTAAEVSFPAPFAVTSAAEGYTLWSKPCASRGEGSGGAVIDRNVAQGAIVRLTLAYPFAARCSRRSLSLEAIYDSSGPNAKRSYGMAPGELLIGSATIRLPRGDHGAPRPHSKPR